MVNDFYNSTPQTAKVTEICQIGISLAGHVDFAETSLKTQLDNLYFCACKGDQLMAMEASYEPASDIFYLNSICLVLEFLNYVFLEMTDHI